MKIELIGPQMPFVWPEPRVSAGAASYAWEPPFESTARSARKVFGVVSAIDSQTINWMEGFLADQANAQLRLVFSIHPTCRTCEADLQEVLRLVERHGNRAGFKLYPERFLTDRSSNLLCFCDTDGSLTISTGPTENLGFAPSSASHANLAIQVTAGAFEACRKWFDYLWGVAGPLRPEIAASMPKLVLPEGDIKAAELWDVFRNQCLDQDLLEQASIRVEVDPESGDVVLIDEHGETVASPTDEIGVPKLDHLAEGLARVYDLGALVSIDKLSRIPPLEAPVKPVWFGVDSFRQTGMVSAQTSFKVAPFDESTLKKIHRLIATSSEVLPRYSFSLADGVRWIPRQAIPLFEAALSAANEEAKKLLGAAIGDSVDSFLSSQRDRIRADAQRMYEAYHPGSKIPDSVVENILDELKSRLDRTRSDKIIPSVAYSTVAFNPSQSSEWSSPWGQAFTLLKGIAAFPRQSMTDRFFWQGINTEEDALIKSMNVAGDYLVKEYGSRNAKQRAEIELDLIKQLEIASCDAKAKCRALWTLITTGKDEEVVALTETPSRE